MNRRAYFFLAVLFAVTLATQGPFTIDVVRVLVRDYPWNDFSVGAPWPSLVRASDYAKAQGLREGDRVLALDGVAPRGYHDSARFLRRHAGETVTIAVEREGRPQHIQFPLRPLTMWRVSAAIALLFTPGLSILLAFWVTAMRPRDLRAWLMLGMLIGLSQVARSQSIDVRAWPLALSGIAVVYREFAIRAWAACMMLFGIYFPHQWSADARRPRVKWVLIIPLALLAVWGAVRSLALTIDFAAGSRWLPSAPPALLQLLLISASISLYFISLAAKFHDQAMAPDDRRRLKLIYWGSAASMAPLVLLVVLPAAILRREAQDGFVLAFSVMALVLFPISLSYSVVVQRAMDVRVVVRQGVQYALARGGVRLVQAAITIGLILLAMSFTSDRMSRTTQVTLIALGVILVIKLRDIGDAVRRWVDRRFFREACDAESILGDLSEQVRSILEKDELLHTVARKIGESLHVERIAVFLADGGVFRPALTTGYPEPMEIALSSETPALRHLHLTRQPVLVQDRSRFEERKALDALDTEVLLPLAGKNELLGVISLGRKKSEEPYSSSDARLLGAVAAQTGLALENSRLSEAIAAEVAQRELLSREIEIAREVQQRLFPQSAPLVPSLEYAGHCRPALGVGGDYYDFLSLPNGRLGLAIADVSGKGIPAALLMASLQASVRGQAQSRGGDVAGLMENVSRLVFDASPGNRYATFFYGQFDPATRRLAYTNGGHNPPMLLRGADVLRLETGGPVVGLFPVARYEQAEIQLQPGDLLVLYTDGVSEAENPAEEEWGEEALVAAASASSALCAAEALSRIMDAADAFAAGAPQHDDMTLVVARVL